MSSNPPNYRELYFEHRLLTRINGKPNFFSLNYLLIELKANAGSVPTTLGEGAHGFIGMIISPATYSTIAPNTPFVMPVHSGTLTHAQGATHFQIQAATTTYNEQFITFHSYQLVQRALVQQVFEGINAKYLSALRNRITGQVPSDIRSLILPLFIIYGKNTPQQLRTRYDNIEKMKYSLDEPIAINFGAVEDLVEIGELYKIPIHYTVGQRVILNYPVSESDMPPLPLRVVITCLTPRGSPFTWTTHYYTVD